MTDKEREDLCEWLRDEDRTNCDRAADEIERLAKENDEFRSRIEQMQSRGSLA